jgi:hypothetical protein
MEVPQPDMMGMLLEPAAKRALTSPLLKHQDETHDLGSGSAVRMIDQL